jgi:hypothetical protein
MELVLYGEAYHFFFIYTPLGHGTLWACKKEIMYIECMRDSISFSSITPTTSMHLALAKPSLNWLIKKNVYWAPGAHTCNPSCLRSKDQEDLGSKPVQANSSVRPCLKTPITHTQKKNAGGVAQDTGPEFKL